MSNSQKCEKTISRLAAELLGEYKAPENLYHALNFESKEKLEQVKQTFPKQFKSLIYLQDPVTYYWIWDKKPSLDDLQSALSVIYSYIDRLEERKPTFRIVTQN